MNILTTLTTYAPPSYLDATYWINRSPNADDVLLLSDAIIEFNKRTYSTTNIPLVFDLHDTLSLDDITKHLNDTLTYVNTVYDTDGVAYTREQIAQRWFGWEPLLQTQWGLVRSRTSLRTIPSLAIFSDEPYDFAFDAFQETTLDMGTPIAAIAQYGAWMFVLAPHYWGWLPESAIHYAPKSDVDDYATAAKHVVLKSHALITTPSGYLVTQMGTPLVLDAPDPDAHVLKVRLPNGTQGWVENNGQVGEPLPCTPRNLVSQAFYLLGQPYSWGGFPQPIWGRDCSRLVKDTYATTGITLPRNADQQEQATPAILTFAEIPIEKRKSEIVAHARLGDMLITPTHIMLYLGDIDGEPYVIHAAGNPARAVIVSTLDYGKTPQVDRLTSLARCSV